MDEKILLSIIDTFPLSKNISTSAILAQYNNHDQVLIPVTYRQFTNYIADNDELYDKFIQRRDTRTKVIELALQEAEDALIENARGGDIRSIEFLLKTQKEEYKEKKKLDVSISAEYLHQIQSLDIAITTNAIPMLEADIEE